MLENNPPPLEDAPVCVGTPWPGAGKVSGNLFKIRKDWPVPPSNNAPTNIITKSNPPTIKTEPQGPNQPRPNSTATKQEKCGWGLNCPICKIVEKDWDSEHQRQLQQPDAKQKTLPKAKTPSKLRTSNMTRNHRTNTLEKRMGEENGTIE